MPRQARVAVSAIFFLFGAAHGGWAPHLADVKRLLGLSSAQLGMCLLGSSIGAVSVMPLAGLLIHRFGSRRVAILSAILLCVAIPPLILAPSPTTLTLMLLVVGLCNGALDVGMNAHSIAVQKRYERPILSAIHAWFSFGAFAGAGGAALAAAVGLPPLLHLLVASAVLVGVALVANRSLLPGREDRGAEGPAFAFPKGPMLLLGMLVFLGFICEGGIGDWAAIYMRDSLGARASWGAIAYGAFALAAAMTRLVGDRLIAQWGHRNVFALSGIVTAVGAWSAVSYPSSAVAIGGYALTGVGVANIVPILFKASGYEPGIGAGAGLAMVSTGGYAGFLVGPPLIGLVADVRSLGFAIAGVGALGLVFPLVAGRAVRRLRP